MQMISAMMNHEPEKVELRKNPQMKWESDSKTLLSWLKNTPSMVKYASTTNQNAYSHPMRLT